MFLVFIFVLGCLILYVDGIYIYVQPTDNLLVYAPPPTPDPQVTPDPKNPWAGRNLIRKEEILASTIIGPVMLVQRYRSFIPLVLVGLAAFTFLVFFIAYVKAKVSAEQRRKP